jgi:hypothetical protein
MDEISRREERLSRDRSEMLSKPCRLRGGNLMNASDQACIRAALAAAGCGNRSKNNGYHEGRCGAGSSLWRHS